MQTFKPVSESREQVSFNWRPISGLGLHTTTMFIFALLGFCLALTLSWLLGNTHVTELFAQLHFIQENPPNWLNPPQVGNKYYLLAPSLVLFLFAQVVIKLSPQPQSWSRRIIAGVLLFLLIRYFLWRSLGSLNLSNPVDGTFSLLILAMEFIAMGGGAIQLLLMFTVKNRKPEADKYSVAVAEKKYNPTVDILIPTYNEPDFILKRTVIGCQALDYENKTIYLLDDTRRPEIKELAKQLGCRYITRADNLHAKAGNLNNALRRTSGELVVVFDADFVPTTNFLTRTVGFFQKENIALVQTPQSFYNHDPISRNLGLEKVLTPEEEVFYRLMQPIKDGAGSVVCAGTSFIARRRALQEIGYFATESVSEDYFTGIRLAANGYELVYLDEKLSAGLAAENITAHIDQRLRWAMGTLQAFFITSNPLTISGLNLWQRLGHLEGLMHWFTCIPRLFFLLVPIAYIFFGINPFLITTSEIVYLFLPYYIMQLTVFAWLNGRSRSIILSDIYSLVQTFPVVLTVIKVMLAPFAKGFKVTPKGLALDKFNFNWTVAFPIVVLFIATLISFSMSLLNPPEFGVNFGLLWSGYNLLTLTIALLTLLDLPKPSFYEWFDRTQAIKIVSDGETYEGITQKISEEGIEVCLDRSINLATSIKLEIIPQGLTLDGRVTRTAIYDETYSAVVKFPNLSLEQHRKLVEMLYCCPGQWQKRKCPGELQSLLIMFKLLLRPLIFLNPKKVQQLKMQY
ncbi:MAG: glycosyltransferase [Pleurocapsa sp.]